MKLTIDSSYECVEHCPAAHGVQVMKAGDARESQYYVCEWSEGFLLVQPRERCGSLDAKTKAGICRTIPFSVYVRMWCVEVAGLQHLTSLPAATACSIMDTSLLSLVFLCVIVFMRDCVCVCVCVCVYACIMQLMWPSLPYSSQYCYTRSIGLQVYRRGARTTPLWWLLLWSEVKLKGQCRLCAPNIK